MPADQKAHELIQILVNELRDHGHGTISDFLRSIISADPEMLEAKCQFLRFVQYQWVVRLKARRIVPILRLRSDAQYLLTAPAPPPRVGLAAEPEPTRRT